MKHRGRALRRRYGHTRSMTFGVMPQYKDFLDHIRSNDPDEDRPYLAAGQTYPIEAHSGSEDERALRRLRIKPTGTGTHGRLKWELTEAQLYKLIKKLGESSDEEAMSLGSGIMQTLGYEWI